MNSLFEEEIRADLDAFFKMEQHTESFAEAASYMAEPHGYHVGPERYLESIQRLKETVSIPVIGSLNGATSGGWTEYAGKIAEAGADALELNLYLLALDPADSGQQVEERSLEVVRSVRKEISIPIAVKVSPFYSSFAHMAARLVEAGADGLVLFNRFYQPDIDIDTEGLTPKLELSTSAELNLRLRWLAVLSGQVEASLSATGGVHDAADVVKAVMAGADSVQMVSALMTHGPGHVGTVLAGVEQWLERNGHDSLDQVRACLAIGNAPYPGFLARANYMKVLDSWKL
jgi:dihydroorotate dehydrogenase (fumarate)